MSDGPIHFLPYVRSGLAAGLDGPAQADAVVTIDVAVRATSTDGSDEIADIEPREFRLLGPESVVALDESVIIARHPQPGHSGFEPNMFASVDFAVADLPWRFTPSGVDADGHLAPWLALVVVEQRDGVWIERSGATPVSVLHVDDAALELPSPATSWAWAHAQFAGDDAGPESLRAALHDGSGRFRSRLVCARRLEPHRRYWACIVPTFASGLAPAGLGDAGSTAHAWNASGPATLPVYDQWEFATGPAGDFESLVRRLEPTEITGSVGLRRIDVRDPGGGLSKSERDPEVVYGGALVSPAALDTLRETDARPTDREVGLRAELRALANAGADLDATDDDPVVAPPAYGRTYVDDPALPDDERQARWFSELNTRPQFRAIAGAAAAVIREHQEEFVDRAWDAAGRLVDANRQLNATALSLEANRVALRRMSSDDDAELLRRFAPAAHAMPTRGGTVGSQLHQSAIPNGVFSGQLRRIGRARNGLRVDSRAGAAADVTTSLLSEPNGPAGVYRDVLAPVGVVAQTARPPRYVPGPGAPGPGRVLLGRPNLANRARIQFKQHEGTQQMVSSVRAAIDPDAMAKRSIRHRIPAATIGAAVPRRVSVTPTFGDALYRRLAERSIELLLPGVGEIQPDTLGLLVTNDAFIEAFLVGANHEIGREFLWREFPTPLDHTWFDHFWQRTLPDIDPIGGWSPAGRLGQHGGGPTGDLVLVIRGELPLRFPTLRLYASRATWAVVPSADGSTDVIIRDEDRGDDDGARPDVKPPTFVARLTDDIVAFGFDLDLVTARGSTTPPQEVPGTAPSPGAGYFFVFEEAPGAPRFGLEVALADDGGSVVYGTTPQDWTTVSWADVTPVGSATPSTFLDLDATPWMNDTVTRPTNGSTPEPWAADAAAVARQTLQRPVRVLVHADSMLPEAR